MLRAIVLDLKTGDVFSETLGWNRTEASVRPSEMWCEILFSYRILNPGNMDVHKGRSIISVPLPGGQEMYTS